MSFGNVIRELKRAALLGSMAVVASIASTGCAAEAGSGSDSNDGHTASTQQAITNGDDDDADSAVVALMLQGKVYCTGVLVAKNVVLTAGHCVSPTPPDQVYFGSKPSSKKGGTLIAVSDSKVHPDFDEDTLVNDVAMVGLAAKAPVAALPVQLDAFDDSFKNMDIRLVGFGIPSSADDSNLRKRTGDSKIVSFTDDDFRFHATPSQTCNGDSGGPALATIGGKEYVIGITSSGDADCKVYGRDIRVDAVLPFLQSYTKAYALKTSAPPQQNTGCSMGTGAPASGSSAAGVLLVLACAFAARARRRATSC